MNLKPTQTMNKYLFALLICMNVTAFGQPSFTRAVDRIADFEKRQELLDNSLVSEIPFKSIGPSVFSGRVSDIDVWEQDPTHFYVGYASGGLWKTENNGQSFSPLFDNEIVMTIGDIAVDWERNTIWIGSGEVNSSRSSYAGVGMFKSTDGGKNWEHKGLSETHHIGRIILHPTDPNTLWVAALGHLYSSNEERGIFKSTDGGETWTKTLFVNENAGAVDLVIDPVNPDILYATTWERTRSAWNFVESGEGSGIYKSTDAGATWTRLNEKKSGFPNGAGVGRIGLAVHENNGQKTMYAVLDNYDRRPEDKKKKDDDLTKDDLRTMSKMDFLKLEKKQVETYLKNNNFPKKYAYATLKKRIEKEEILPIALVEYVEDANSLLFDTPVIGAEVYRSDDEGKTWQKTHEGYLDNVYNSYGYYFGQIRISPNNPDKIYIMGVPVLRSEDAGKTWKSINGANVHADHHALWASSERDKHLILGNDGGINISYDDGENWTKCNTPAVGQFYYVAVDMAEPYNVYGGLQDNGVWMGKKTYKASNRWHNSGHYPYKSIMGGDGMQVAIDTRDNATVYTGYQFGNYFRLNTQTDDQKYITPKHELGDRPLRWNWQTPIHLSVHNQDILYMGSNKLHRSFNQGDDFIEISDDLTKGGKKGDVAFGTLTTIHESPLKFGLLYAGSDDGLVHVSKDGGNTWKKISDALPENQWITRIQASKYNQGRVYISMNGYRQDNFQSLIYTSENYGDTWTKIGFDLPAEPVNVIKEDPENENLIYVGTDHGLYVSLDRGKSFMLMNKDLPAVSVHDVVVHPRDKEILVGTHGRSLYLADAQHLQKLTSEILEKSLYVFDLEKVRVSSRWGNPWSMWRDAPEPTIEIPVFTNAAGTIKTTILMDDLALFSFENEVKKGLQYLTYKGHVDGQAVVKYERLLNAKKEKDADKIKVEKAKNDLFYLKKGTYKVRVEKGGVVEEKELILVL